MAGSSIRCTDEQRREIILLKMELKQIFGFEPKDRELVDMFLKAFKEKQPIFLSEILERVADKLKEIAVNVEDYEKLKQENEELRKEVEALREKVKKSTYNDLANLTSRSLFWKFIEKVREELGNHPNKDEVLDRLVEIGMQIFKGDRIRPSAVLRLNLEVI